MKLQISLSATPIVYHLTSIKNAVSMAQSNRFELTPADGQEEEEKLSAGLYYMSTTRHRLGGFTLNMIDRFSVILTLDGIKLNSRYKIKPVNFYDGDDSEEESESEDRILSKNPFIEKANQYIKEIHAFRGDNAKDFSGNKGNQLIKLSRYCLKNRISIYFYSDEKSFLLLNKRQAVPLNIVNLPRDKAAPIDLRRGKTLEEFKSEHRVNELTGWLQLYSISTPTSESRARVLWNQNISIKYAFEVLMKEPRKTAKPKLKGWGADRTPEVLERRFYNRVQDVVKSMSQCQRIAYGDISRGREDVDRLVKILRARKWTVEQFVIAMYDKWSPFMPQEWKQEEEEA